jgi:hypothetical protein
MTVLAVNRTAEKCGMQIGIKCYSIPPLESHRWCNANAALIAKECRYSKLKGSLGDVITYLLPVDGYPDYYIHFSVGFRIDYENGSAVTG